MFAFSEQISLFLLARALRRARVVARDIGGVSARRRDARVRETEMSAFAEDETIEHLLDEDEEVEDLTGEAGFPPPPGPSTMASGGGNTEARFLVVDPALHGVTYTKEGKVKKPRIEIIVNTHNALIQALPAKAKEWGRTSSITKQIAKHDYNALLFIAAHTMDTKDVHFNAQLHAWVEEYYKHAQQKQWLLNGACDPVDLRQVLTNQEYDNLIAGAEKYGATNAIVNAFKSNTDRLRDSQAITKLYTSTEGRALTEFLVQSLKARNLGAEARTRTSRPVFDAYIARLVERSGATADPAARLDQTLLKILRESDDPAVLNQARVWLHKQKQKDSLSDQDRQTWLREIAKHGEKLIRAGVDIGNVGAGLADAASSRVVDAAQRGVGIGGASIAQRGAGGASTSANTGARFEHTLAGLGHGTNPESESQRNLRAATSRFPGYETTYDAAFETSAFGETPERRNAEPLRTSEGPPIVLDFEDTPQQEPPAPQGPAASEPAASPEPAATPSMDEILMLLESVRKSPHVPDDTSLVDLQAALHACSYDVDATVRLLLVRASLPAGVDLAVTDAISRRDVLAALDTDVLRKSLSGAVTRTSQRPAIKRKASDNVNMGEVKRFAKAVWPDYDPMNMTEESIRRGLVAGRIVGLLDGGTASRSRAMEEARKTRIAKACMALPPTLNDFDAVIIAEAALRDAIGAGVDFPSHETVAALGEIVHAVLHSPRTSSGE